MSQPTKTLTRAKQRAIMMLPCDGLPRYVVKGSPVDVKICYSAAYECIFRNEGGTYQPGIGSDSKASRVWTPKGMKRIAALNAQYMPFARKCYAAMQAARDLAPPPPLPPVALDKAPPAPTVVP